MRVLQLASFNGNIGDNANHSGFRPWLEKLSGRTVAWTDLEIREFYWKERAFDASFVELVSRFDLLVVGGGNFFELWVERSATGTSFDIAPELFAQIRIPVFFNALGCDEGQGVTETSIRKFTRFLEALVSSRQYLVTVRNDGARKTLRARVPGALAEKVHVIPDAGFFLDYRDGEAPYLKPAAKRIGLNLASDMAEIRFGNFGPAGGYAGFCDEFAGLLDSIAAEDPEVQYVFFPHIFRDLQVDADIIARLGDRLRRTRVSSAPYVTGAEGARYVFGLYRKCRLFVGMRFHANVCALGLGVPVIGLGNYPQIDALYEEIGNPGGCLNVRAPGFSAPLRRMITASLSERGPDAAGKRVLQRVTEMRRAFEPTFLAWLRDNALVRTV